MKKQYIKPVEKELFLPRKVKKEIMRDLNEVFSSALQASKKVGLKSSAGISKCCSGERKTAGQLHWEFVKGDRQ